MTHPIVQSYRPPEGFIALDSQVEGVTLFGPASDDEVALQTRTRCPGCGAALAWDPSAGAMRCDYCGTQLTARRGEEAGPGEFTVEAMQRGEQGWGADRPELRCDGCGAVLTVQREQLASSCPLCGSNQVHVHEATGEALRPGHVLPFSVDVATASARAKEWLGTGWLRPSGVQEAANMDHFTGVYLPFWIFRADMSADYQVQVGTNETRTRTRSDGSSYTETYIAWRWESGHLDVPRAVATVPATHQVPGIENVKPFPLDRLLPYTPDVLVGFVAHGYEIALPEGWEEGRDRLRRVMQQSCCHRHRGDHYRSFSATVDFDDESWKYALLPVWLSAYRWNDRNWVVLVNGATGQIDGTRPVVWLRVYVAIAAMLSPAFFIGACLGLPGLAFAGVGFVFLILAFILLIFGLVGSGLVYQQASGEENL